MNLNGRNLLVGCALAVLCTVAFTPVVRAQSSDASQTQSAQTPTQTSTATHVQPGQTAAAAKQQTMQERNGGSNERVLWVLPNFLSVEEDSYKGPITAGQKFKLV